MTQRDHADALRAATEALNAALSAAAAAGVGATITVLIVASGTPATEQQVQIAPFARL